MRDPVVEKCKLYTSKTGHKGVIPGVGSQNRRKRVLCNRKIQQDGILAESRRRGHYEKPSVKRKKKEEAARRRKNSRKG
jgi:ribosomal protein S21